MAIGKSIGSKLDRNGATFAARHEAIKAASKLASRAIESADHKQAAERVIKSFTSDADRSSRFGKGLKAK